MDGRRIVLSPLSFSHLLSFFLSVRAEAAESRLELLQRWSLRIHSFPPLTVSLSQSRSPFSISSSSTSFHPASSHFFFSFSSSFLEETIIYYSVSLYIAIALLPFKTSFLSLSDQVSSQFLSQKDSKENLFLSHSFLSFTHWSKFTQTERERE